MRKLAGLVRFWIAAAVGISAAAGHILAAGAFGTGSFLVFAGTFCLTASVSIINQIQEKDRDRRMARTRERLLASGRLDDRTAWIMAAACVLGSVLLLWSGLGWHAGVIAMLVIGLYNGLYTPLKPRTLWAMIPGAACGALPFWIGWLAGGGRWNAAMPVYFFCVYFLWQMPHFWMLAEMHVDEYAAAGFVVPAVRFSPPARVVIPKVWATAVAVTGGMLPLMTRLPDALVLWLYACCVAYAGLSWCVSPRLLRMLSDGFVLVLLGMALTHVLA